VPLGIDISCTTKTIQWMDHKIPWKPKSYFNNSILSDPVACQTHCFFFNDDSFLDETTFNCFNSALLESKYEAIDVHQVAKQQLQLDHKNKMT
jgi:hypothetical protein